MSGLEPEALLAAAPAALPAAAAHASEAERARALRGLLAVAEDAKRPLGERLAAGDALGALGDPRIDPLRPALVEVPAGPFSMGMAPEEVAPVAREFDLPEAWLRKACPRHTVELDAFAVARFPVTQGEWARFRCATGHPERPEAWPTGRLEAGRESHPVWGVSFEAALAYCEWLSRETGLRYRLPTEAEWEKAARGTDARAFPWGARFDARRANTREAGVGDTSPVGIFPDGASPYGALDLGGNVEEYTASREAPYPGGPREAAPEGPRRVTRGGCFRLDGDLARCDRRHAPGMGGAVGFRLARSRAARGEAAGEPEGAR